MPTPKLLLVDDDFDHLKRLEASVKDALADAPAEIVLWQPGKDSRLKDWQEDTRKNRPDFVVTDLDLTENGAPGLSGGGLVAFCRAHTIPIGIYSRQTMDDLEEPQIFDFRFDRDHRVSATDIANLLIGFDRLKQMLEQDTPKRQRNWATALADLLGHPEVANSFSLYSVRSGASPSNVLSRLTEQFNAGEAKLLLETYVIGHLLCNGILKYPGPLLSDVALCSYAGVPDKHKDKVSALFEKARYDGPFGDRKAYFWQRKVDDIYLELIEELGLDEDEDISADHFRRSILTAKFGPLDPHSCGRCEGLRGGYRCPYTERPTCDRNDCSYPTSSWVPQGAFLTRPEKNFVDEHSPLLGL